MSKRKKSVPQQLNKNERNSLQWELSIPAACNSFEVVEAPQPMEDNVSAKPSVSQGSSKYSPSTDTSTTLVLCTTVSQPEDATLFYLGSVPLSVVAPITSAGTDWSNFNEVVLTVNNVNNLACIKCGDRVYPVSFGDFDVAVIRYLYEKCFRLKLDSFGDFRAQISVFLSVENEIQTKLSKGVTTVLTQFFPHTKVSSGAPGRLACNSRHDMAALFSAVTQYHRRKVVDAALPTQPPYLRPRLRLYQREALRWMLSREGPAQPFSAQLSSWIELESPGLESGSSSGFPQLDSSRSLFLDRLTGTLSWSLPPLPLHPSGGILADEMGLGKTVEVLALVLSNPRPAASNQSDCRESAAGDNDRISSDLDAGFGDSVALGRNADEDEGTSEGDARLMLEGIQDSKPEPPSDGDRDQCSVDEELNDVEVIFKSEKKQKSRLSKREKKTTGRKRRSQDNAEDGDTEVKVKKVNLVREAANRWYEEQLASTKRWRSSNDSTGEDVAASKTFKCMCGKNSLAGSIQCQHCLTWQHCKCMGVPQGSRPKSYFCPQCWQNKEAIPSGATLIISPSSICRQWETEVKKHISDPEFSLLVYTGVSGLRYVQPTRLATQTIVLTTYETLRKELDFADLDPADNLRFRHAKRFVAPSSPLLCIGWWRVCLDEAQMAQSLSSKVFSMAQRLYAEHRWAVTGTPVTKSVSDLRGTLQFFGLPTLTEPRWWRTLVSAPLALGDHRPLDALAPLMWRTAKADVADQINIPKQSETLHWVTFSAVEEFFYQRQQEAAETAFIRGMDRVCGDMDADLVRLSSLDRHTMTRVLAPLLRLRQACTHPGVARGNNISFQGSALTMEELLESLIKKAVVDCEDALRLQIAALNGLGAVEAMRGRPGDAASSYRTVLSLAAEHEGTLTVDRLQLIHATHNLADLLDFFGAGTATIPHTLRDHKLREESAEMERQYMRRHHAQVETSAAALAELTAQVVELELALSSNESWWRVLALALAARGDGTELSSRLNDAFADANNSGLKASKKAQRTLCGSVHAMIAELGRWVAGCEESRDIALEALDSLREKSADPDTVAAAVTCHIRAGNAQHDRKQRNKCVVCRCETQLKAYESQLFTMSAEHNKHELIGDVVMLGQLTQGTWQASAHEITLKTLLALAKIRKESDKWLGAGATHLKMLDAAKKEFKRARALWTSVRDEIAARDELGLCRTKLRLRLPGEVVDKKTRDDQLANLHIIEQHEIEITHDRLESELVVAADDLRKKRGQLGYLKTLRKRADLETNPDPCPICQQPVGNKWSVLPCGHVFCLDCLLLLGSHGRRNVRCAVCREEAALSAVTHVSLALPTSEAATPTSNDAPPTSESVSNGVPPSDVAPPITDPVLPALPFPALETAEVKVLEERAECAKREDPDFALSDCKSATGEMVAADEAAETKSVPVTVKCEAACTSDNQTCHEAVMSAGAISKNVDITLHTKDLLKDVDGATCKTCSSAGGTEANGVCDMSSEAAVTVLHPSLSKETSSGEPCEATSANANDSTPTGTEGAKAALLRVRGSHSAKVGAVVRCLLNLRATEAAVKVLVFSTWDKVLDILEVALRQNSILFERLKPGKAYLSRLEAFKTQARVTALLLPLRSGSKGLNLTEATHLMFVEPVLEPEFELQALGRIHRIGQTRETMVHRFLIHGSLEERIHAAVRADTASWHDDKVTLGQLRRLLSVNDVPNGSQESQPQDSSRASPVITDL